MEAPKFDVQSALAAMGDYPAVLRRFGVIRVLEIDLAGTGIDPATAGPVTVSATPTWTTKLPPAQVKLVPVTVPGHLSATRFALSADSRVDLNAAKVTVTEVDSDSAAARLLDLARHVVNAENANGGEGLETDQLPPVKLPDQLALPPMRNAGLSLNQGDRSLDLRSRLEAGKALHTADTAQTLTDAKQAVLGHVLDVWDDRTNKWHTVCARRGTYQLPGGKSFTLDDEGVISLGATAKPDATAFSPMYLHQSLVRWRGWSLVAPRPGKLVETENPGEQPQPGGPALPGFSASFEAKPGSLPTLRYGVGYRFQLRQVDVTGQADPLVPGSGDFTRATPLTKYLRFDPIVAPVVIAAEPMTEGESVETLVLRTEPWAGGQVGSQLSQIMSGLPHRHIVPPKVPEILCEEHGKLDRPNGTPDPARYQQISARDAADLTTVGKPDPTRPGQRYVNSASVDVTWLPDPLSRGAALSGLPTGLLKVGFETWPDAKSFRLRLAEGDGKPSWSIFNRTMTLYVPRGEQRSIRLSSHLSQADLALLGQVEWLADTGIPAAELDAAKADVVNGQAWQVTPYRTLNLVNAVRVPVKAPVLAQIGADPGKPRTLGSTQQELKAQANVHRPSTGQLALAAQWTDPIDDPAQPAPTTRTAKATPKVFALDYGDAAAVDFTASHAFGDTKRHRVDYSLVGTTRYMEYFVQRGQITLQGTTPVTVAQAGIAPGTDTVRSSDGLTSYRRDVDYSVDLGTGKIARLAGGSIPNGAKVEVAIVALPVSRPSPAKVQVDLPSTARPLPPKVAWIVPTFGWKESSANLGLVKTRARSGGGLRIFLERGWYSSGVDEQLAVVVGNGGTPADPQLLALITQVGGDPAVVSAAAQRFPAPTDFPLAAARRGDLEPAELPGARVAVAAHDVTWDAERGKWACDVVLPPGPAYQPFVSLALARYQGNSLAKAELSPLAAVEWMQLAPDRSATVTMDYVDLTHVKLTVAGRSASATDAAAGPNAVSVIVQSSDAFVPGDLDWQIVGSPDGQPLAAAAQPDGSTVWSATLTLPTPRLLKPYRLIVTERERNTGGGRLVYSDVIRL